MKRLFDEQVENHTDLENIYKSFHTESLYQSPFFLFSTHFFLSGALRGMGNSTIIMHNRIPSLGNRSSYSGLSGSLCLTFAKPTLLIWKQGPHSYTGRRAEVQGQLTRVDEASSCLRILLESDISVTLLSGI